MRDELEEIAARLEPRFAVVAAMLVEPKEDVTAFTAFPVGHWRKVWSTNPLEVNVDIERRFVERLISTAIQDKLGGGRIPQLAFRPRTAAV